MLKALELAGFKSFADKTRFEFPEGITVIVGPNGSGKSNVVDAVKWVLGEQSAKSLRGKDMVDVIFKGSGGGRKPLNTAEATLIIENSDGRLPIDAPEVHVTRRVYRGGEGEYLINRQPCRLKDIRDLFRGTGVGTDAYSLIEQGKVDQLLQASAKERRAIFEEAAGISRFKAKRIECERRLARVDQNLVRLADIVEEVESRLRSVRSQASKARRYRQYTQRLQQLRTHVGQADWRALSERLEQTQTEQRRLQEESADLSQQAETTQQHLSQVESALNEIAERQRLSESQLAQRRERIVTCQATADHQRARFLELEEQIRDLRHMGLEQRLRVSDLSRRLADAGQARRQAELDHQKIVDEVETLDRDLGQLTTQIESRRRETADCRDRYMDRMRLAARLGNEASAFQSEAASAQAQMEQAAQRRRAVEQECENQKRQLDELTQSESQLADAAAEKVAQWEAARDAMTEARQQLAKRQDEFSQLQTRRIAAQERAAVLEELERKLEGLGAGVKEILNNSRQPEPGAFGDVRGMVADLFQVNVDMAPLVDAALGEASQYIVLSGDRLLQLLRSGEYHPPGQVGFVRASRRGRMGPLSRPTPSVIGSGQWSQPTAGVPTSSPPSISGHPGVVCRAPAVVQTDSQFADLVDRFLGATWFVETLADAERLHQSAPGRYRFVTMAGDVYQPDGCLVVGPRRLAGGLLSRRSELRALQREMQELEKSLAGAQAKISDFHREIDRLEKSQEQLAQQSKAAGEALAVHRHRVANLREKFEEASRRLEAILQEIRAAQARHEEAQRRGEQTEQQIIATQAELTQLEQQLHSSDEEIRQNDERREALTRQTTSAKVRLAKSGEQVVALAAQEEQLTADLAERRRSLDESLTQLSLLTQKHDQASAKILQAGSEIAILYHQKETYLRDTNSLSQQRADLETQRRRFAQQESQLQQQLHQNEEQTHKQELALGEINHQRATLAERLRDDYGVEIADLEQPVSEEDLAERDSIDAEIADLRRKVNQIGAVNLDALEELEDLEQRFEMLSGQYQDLAGAKESLEKIIQKINTDSRRLFVETVEAIRVNFQTLYRKAFGGGHADIVFEEGEDVLECGVEIVATPPGKPSFNNSLLSGGEKALTAVSLLLAIFQFRPSPFCVLDEVDAPFDEANIGRFMEVLKEFLGWTRFVIVTHSKKTMTSADTLYGVTMQESGVSKRVSVRFEDVSEDGHINQAAPSEDERGAA